MKGKIQFKEEQSFKNSWMYFLVIGICFLALASTMIPMIVNKEFSESILGLIIALVVSLGLIALFTFSKLITMVDDKAIYYKFPPFINSEKKLTRHDIEELYVRKYRPIWEYGGWGYRIRPGKGKALNISGNMGLQIRTSKGESLLIGTGKPQELEQAIGRLKENWEMND